MIYNVDIAESPNWTGKHQKFDAVCRETRDAITQSRDPEHDMARKLVDGRAQDGQVWLGKPLRMVELDPVGLFSDGQNEVWPNGTGFSIKHSRDGMVEDKVYQTQDACRVEILRRRPTRAA